MQTNQIYNINPDYEKAGLSGEGLHAVLEDYSLAISQEIGLRKRPAVIICPGGGYEYLSDREGQAVAMRFSSFGINAFVLKYSICTAFPAALLELAEAVKFLRDNSEKFDIDPDKILICGFSAGGHLSASLGTLWNSSYLKSIFGKTEIYRPNGLILSYPVITSGQFRHEGSIESIIGKNPDNAMLELVSLEKQVTPDTPKTFIWHCADDGCVPPENTFDFVKALSLNNVSFECHIFPYGGHGLALSDASTAGYDGHINPVTAQWFSLATGWISREFL